MTRSWAVEALSAYNLTNAREAGPTTEKEQRGWFGGGGRKRPRFGILPRHLLGKALLGKHIFQNG